MSDPMERRQCTAKAKGSGKRCKRPPTVGGTVCAMHGGKAPQVKAAIERRRQERAAVLAVESFGLPREVDPHAALLEELHRTAGAVQWLGAVVSDIERDALVWGDAKETHGAHQDEGEKVRSEKRAGVNVWVQLWQAERKHLVDVSRECIKSGIEERRVRVAEAAGQQLASVVRAVLDRLGLTDEQRSLALVVVPEEFRRLGELEAGPGGAA